MLGTSPTKEEIINYLTMENLSSKYRCDNKTLCQEFINKTDSVKATEQFIVFGNNAPQRIWWIEFNTDANKFTLRCAYFDKDDTPISQQEFLNQLIQYWTDNPPLFPVTEEITIEEYASQLPCVTYNTDTLVEWISTNTNEWSIKYTTENHISIFFPIGELVNVHGLHKIFTM